MGYVLSILLTCFQMLAASMLFDAFFIRRYTSPKFYALLVLWMCVSILEVNIIPPNSGMLLFIVEIIVFGGMNFTLYKGSWDRRLFVTVTQYACVFSLSYLTQTNIAAILHLSHIELINQRALYTLVLFINVLEFFLLSISIKHFHTKPSYVTKPRIWVPIATFFPVCTLFILMMARIIQPENAAWNISLAIMCVVDIVALLVLDSLENTIHTQELLAVSNQRMEMQQANLKALSESYSAQRKLTHEFRKYLTVLSELLAQNSIKAAQEYLEELKILQTERILLVNTHNPLLDAILNQQGYAAQDKGIDIRFEINDLSGIRISPMDLTTVMGNLLDNAIEGCERLDPNQKRWISVKAIYNSEEQPRSFFFSVVNTSQKVTISEEKIPSTKNEPELHGYGLPNVLSILQKYNAEYSMSYKDGLFIFALECPESLTLEKKEPKHKL